MQVGAIGANVFGAYVYNTNTVNRGSLNKVSKVPDDVLNRKIEQSKGSDSLTGETTNPLAKGETANFNEMLDMQFALASANATRIGI